MAFKTILSVIGVNHFEEDLKQAVALCQSADAHLSAMVMAMSAPPPYGDYGQAVSTAWLEEREGDIATLARPTEVVKETLKTAGLSHDVQAIYTEFAWADEDIALRALYADLALIGGQAAADEDLRRKIINGALFQSPAPVLFNATDKAATLAPASVLLAWDSRPEAARALRHALPILKTAAEVHVTLVDPVAASARNGEEPGADIAAYLARHDVPVIVDVLSGGGRPVDETLRQHAADVGAELLVMGGYSHSRLRERIFGGVTQSMLENAKLPILLAH